MKIMRLDISALVNVPLTENEWKGLQEKGEKGLALVVEKSVRDMLEEYFHNDEHKNGTAVKNCNVIVDTYDTENL